MKTLTEAKPVGEEQAVVVRRSGDHSVARLTKNELTERLTFIKEVMEQVMKEGTDFGKVPGCGEKPTLLQPGAQKLGLTFQLRDQVKRENIKEYPGYHREYELTVEVRPLGTTSGEGWDGVGTCSTLEGKYRYRNGGRTCPRCHRATIIKGKAQYGGGWVCFEKKGGCGAKFKDGSELGNQIADQADGKVEHDNPADYWNTVRKMAFKRAFVHAIINATNTSELWTQDLEELRDNGVVGTPKHDDSDDGDLGPQKQSGASGKRGYGGPGLESPRAGAAGQPPVGTQQSGAGGRDVKSSQEASRQPVKEPSSQGAPRVGTFIPCADEKRRDDVINVIIEKGYQEEAKAFLVAWDAILPTETLAEWPLDKVPVNDSQFRFFAAAMNEFVERGEFAEPYPRNGQRFDNPKAKPVEAPKAADWRAFPVPATFKKNAGIPLGKLEPKSLAWYIQNVKVTTTFEGRNGTVTKRPEAIAADRAFRAALDAAKAELAATEEAA